MSNSSIQGVPAAFETKNNYCKIVLALNHRYPLFILTDHQTRHKISQTLKLEAILLQGKYWLEYNILYIYPEMEPQNTLKHH